MDDLDLRLIALDAAMEIEGDKALTGDVLSAAEQIYAFLTGFEPNEGKPN